MASDKQSPPEVPSETESDFEQLAQQSDPGLIREFFDFLRYNKKWWMTPIILGLLMLSLIAFLSATPAAPFIYSLF